MGLRHLCGATNLHNHIVVMWYCLCSFETQEKAMAMYMYRL
jgi:hypothetical protein